VSPVLDSELGQLPGGVQGVGNVEIVGGREREIHVEVDPAALASRNLTVADIQKTAARWLDTRNRLLIRVHPETGGRAEAGASR